MIAIEPGDKTQANPIDRVVLPPFDRAQDVVAAAFRLLLQKRGEVKTSVKTSTLASASREREETPTRE